MNTTIPDSEPVEVVPSAEVWKRSHPAGRLHRIGETVSETLDRVAAVLRVLRTIRPKYACRACEEPRVLVPVELVDQRITRGAPQCEALL